MLLLILVIVLALALVGGLAILLHPLFWLGLLLVVLLVGVGGYGRYHH